MTMHAFPGAVVRDRSEPVGVGLATATGIAVCGGLIGAILDAGTGHTVRLLFLIGFTIGCGLAATLVRRDEALATVVMAPIVYLLMLIGGGLVTGGGITWYIEAFVVKAPVVLVATAVAALIAIPRSRVSRP
jgi:hypothetical protein